MFASTLSLTSGAVKHTIKVDCSEFEADSGTTKTLPVGSHIIQGHPEEVHTKVHIVRQVALLILKVLGWDFLCVCITNLLIFQYVNNKQQVNGFAG